MRTSDSVKLGDIVYPAYIPAQAGRVIAIDWKSEYLPRVTIATRTGREISTRSFYFYEDLVEDHRRKYERHKAVLEELQKLEGAS